MMIAMDMKTTLQVIHTKAVNKDVNSQGRNVVLDDRHPVINISEKELSNQGATHEPRPAKIRTLQTN